MMTIYITNEKMSFLELSSHRERKVVHWFELDDIESMNIQEIEKNLSAVIKEKQWLGCSAIVGVSHHFVTSIQARQEKYLSDWELYRFIQTHFHQYFEGKHIDDYYMDFEIIDSGEKTSQNQTLQIFASPRRLIEPYVALLKNIGLKPKAFNIDTLALEAALADSTSMFNGDVKWASLKILMILESGIVWLIERLNWGKLRLASHALSGTSPIAFLDFFRLFKEDFLEEAEVFCIGQPKAILPLKEALASSGITSHLINPFYRFTLCQPDISDFIESHPFSFIVHVGLKKSYGY